MQTYSQATLCTSKTRGTHIRFGNGLILFSIVVALGLRLVSEQTAILSYVVLSILALFGLRHTILALAMSWLITMLNPGLAPVSPYVDLGRYFVILAAAGSVFLKSGVVWTVRVHKLIFCTLCLGAFFIVHSLVVSPIRSVSLLKALTWTIVIMTLLAAWSILRTEERNKLSDHLYFGLVAVALLSLPLILLPVGFLRNNLGFQGILNHPQAFGVTMALLGAWTVGRLLGTFRPHWGSVLLVVLCLVLISLSESRTAGLAMVFGVGTAVPVAALLSGRKIASILPSIRSQRFWLILTLCLSALIIASPILSEQINQFITKSGRADASSLGEAYYESRGVLIDPMLENVAAAPFRGIGFGIASHPKIMDLRRDPVLGLPIGASVEKGVMPLAVLEEVGVFGLLFVLLWLGMLLRRSARSGIAPFTVVLTILDINLGESVFFSPGGMGMLCLILFGWAVTKGRVANQREA